MYMCWRVNAEATFWVFGAPYLVSSLLLMFGNWSQHIFINPKNHTSSWNLTYNIINTPMNQLTYNDGYHIAHHVHSTLHWSQLPHWFLANEQRLAEHGALTFEGLDYFLIGVYVMTGQLDRLADHYVHIGPKHLHRSPDAVRTTLRQWLAPIAQ